MGKAIYEKKNRIAYVTLNRPDALNALDDEMNDELWAIWRDFNDDPSVDVAILTGAGKAFCAGADLKTFIPKWEHANMLDARRNSARGIGGGITRGQHRMTKPIIAAERLIRWGETRVFTSRPRSPIAGPTRERRKRW